MKTRYHIEITKRSLEKHFSEYALRQIIIANIKQDRIRYQFRHDHIHFDGNAFDRGLFYITYQEESLISAVKSGHFSNARKALGRITHSWQDFYSHSNYVNLWLNQTTIEEPQLISYDDENIFHHSELKSGKSYGLIEFIAMIPLISKVIKPLMPSDSHAQMNHDSPADSNDFDFVYWAAFNQTKAVFDKIMQQLIESDIEQMKINQFLGK